MPVVAVRAKLARERTTRCGLGKKIEDIKTISQNILGNRLVTLQTSAEGKVVNKVFIAEDMYYPGDSEPKEFYMSILLDRGRSKNVIMYSPEGGMNIEEVAKNAATHL